MQKLVLFLTAFLFFSVLAVQAQKPEVVTNKKAGWHRIGRAKVDFKSEKDQFIILGADRFKAIRIKVNDSPIHLEDMQVQYQGGTTEDVQLRSDFKAGAQSREIDLKNNSAEIKSVSFVYHTVNSAKTKGKAQIELWGLK